MWCCQGRHNRFEYCSFSHSASGRCSRRNIGVSPKLMPTAGRVAGSSSAHALDHALAMFPRIFREGSVAYACEAERRVRSLIGYPLLFRTVGTAHADDRKVGKRQRSSVASTFDLGGPLLFLPRCFSCRTTLRGSVASPDLEGHDIRGCG